MNKKTTMELQKIISGHMVVNDKIVVCYKTKMKEEVVVHKLMWRINGA